MDVYLTFVFGTFAACL